MNKIIQSLALGLVLASSFTNLTSFNVLAQNVTNNTNATNLYGTSGTVSSQSQTNQRDGALTSQAIAINLSTIAQSSIGFPAFRESFIAYTIDLSATGDEDLEGSSVVVTVPDGLTYVDVITEPTNGAYDPATNTWTIGTIIPEFADSITLQFQVDADVAVPSTLQLLSTFVENDADVDFVPAVISALDLDIDYYYSDISVVSSVTPSAFGELITFIATIQFPINSGDTGQPLECLMSFIINQGQPDERTFAVVSTSNRVAAAEIANLPIGVNTITAQCNASPYENLIIRNGLATQQVISIELARTGDSALTIIAATFVSALALTAISFSLLRRKNS